MNAKTREKLQLNMVDSLAPARISHKNTVKLFTHSIFIYPVQEISCRFRYIVVGGYILYRWKCTRSATLKKFLLPLETVISLIVLGLEKN